MSKRLTKTPKWAQLDDDKEEIKNKKAKKGKFL